jgi:hypothetical protein
MSARAFANTMLASYALPWVLISALVIALVATCAHRPSAPAIPPQLSQTIDSLGRSHFADSTRRDSLRASAHDLQHIAAATGTRSVQTSEHAAVNGHIADSLAQLASRALSAEDSARFYSGAYQRRTAERDTLLTALQLERTARGQDQQAADAFRLASNAAEARLRVSEGVVIGLRAAIAEASKPCRIARFVPCPTRGQAFAGGMIVGAVAAVSLRGVSTH